MARSKNIKKSNRRQVNPVFIQVGILLGLVLVAYSNTFQHGWNLDDFLIQNNLPLVEEGWKGVFSVFGKAFNFYDYRPVSMLTFAVEQQLQGGLKTGTAHVMNVVYYAICCLVLFAFLRRLPVENAALLAFVATALFIAHPIHSNVISSMKNRDSILSLTISLLSLMAMLQFIKYTHPKRSLAIAGKTGYFMLAVVIFFVAIITKLDSLTMIVILPLFLMIFWKHWWTLLFGAGFGFLLFRAFEYVRYRLITPRFLETTSGEESTLITENPIVVNDAVAVKVSSALVSVFYYLKFHLVPKGYYYYFGFDMVQIDKLWTLPNIIALATMLLAGAAFFYFLRKKPEVSLAIGFFFGGLSYCMNVLTPIAGIVAPRLAFIASVGFCILLAIVLIEAGPLVRKKFKLKWNGRQVTYGLLGLILLIYLPFTIHRNSAWKDIYTLIERDAPRTTRSFEAQRIACMNYMTRAEGERDRKKADQYWKKCLDYGLKASAVYDEDQYVEEAIGIAHFRVGNNRSAFIQFKEVLEKFDTTEIANEMIGDVFMQMERPDSAAAYYETLVHTAPEAQVAYIKYTQAMVAAGRIDEGIDKCLEFARKYPEAPYMLESLGYLNLINGDTLAGADFLFAAIYSGAPPEGYLNVLQPYFERNSLDAAWQDFENGNVKTVDELLMIHDPDGGQ